VRRVVLFVLRAAVLAGVGLASASPGFGVSEAKAAEQSASDCLGFETRDADKGIDYSLRNACEKKLSCNVSWKLSCEDTKGTTTAVSSKSERFQLSGSDEHVVHASADVCKAGWRIDAVTWSCG
jgi:hypothetical protein